MATVKDAIFKAKVNGELTELLFRTGVDNIFLVENNVEITLTQKLADIVTMLEDTTATDTTIDEKITQAIADLVDSAPESLDTLKELADAITANQDLVDTLNSAIGDKVDKEDGKELIASTLLTTLTAMDFTLLGSITQAKIDAWDNADSNTIESITVNGEATTITSKNVDLAIPTIIIGTDEPTTMNDNDLFLQIVE